MFSRVEEKIIQYKQKREADAMLKNIDFIPCKDHKGCQLNNIDDIEFHKYKKREQSPVWNEDGNKVDYYTISSAVKAMEEGHTIRFNWPINSVCASFPISIEVDGELYSRKVSAITKTNLSSMAGASLIYTIGYVGPPSSGKTCSVLQMMSNSYVQALVGKTNLSVSVTNRDEIERYRELSKSFMGEKILPSRTMLNEDIPVITYQLSNKFGDRFRNAVIAIADTAGEAVVNGNAKTSNALGSDINIINVPVNSLNDPLRVEYVDEAIDEIVASVASNLFKNQLFILNITCSDSATDFDDERAYNSVEVSYEKVGENEILRIKDVIHSEGFDENKFNEKQEAIKDYLKKKNPNLFNKLVNFIPPSNLCFTMTACIGENPTMNAEDGSYEYTFENMDSVTEPIILALRHIGIYPTRLEENMQDERLVRNEGLIKVPAMEKIINNVSDVVRKKV